MSYDVNVFNNTSKLSTCPLDINKSLLANTTILVLRTKNFKINFSVIFQFALAVNSQLVPQATSSANFT